MWKQKHNTRKQSSTKRNSTAGCLTHQTSPNLLTVSVAEHRQENIENKKMESPVNLFKNLSQIGIVEVFYSLLLRENIFCKNVHFLHLWNEAVIPYLASQSPLSVVSSSKFPFLGENGFMEPWAGEIWISAWLPLRACEGKDGGKTWKRSA